MTSHGFLFMNDKIKNSFIDYLKKNKHRITNERVLILDSALNLKDHFNADELYDKMRQDFFKVSRATVYNTLELMSKCGILTKHNFKGDRSRFEKKFGRKNHYHIICFKCGKITEFENDSIEKTLKKLCNERNMNLFDHSLQVFAECSDSSKCNH